MRPRLIAFCLGLAGAGIALLDWTWTQSGEGDFGVVYRAGGALKERDQGEEFEARASEARQRRDAVARVGARFCAGELTPAEATDVAAAIMAGDPVWREQARQLYEGLGWAPPGASDRELGACCLRARLDTVRAEAESQGDAVRLALVADCIGQLDDLPAVPFDALTLDAARDMNGREVAVAFTSCCSPHTWLVGEAVLTICGPSSADGQERTAVLRGNCVGKLRDGKRVRAIGTIRVIRHEAAQVGGGVVPAWDEIRFEER